jgi:hypothetical protein
LQHEHAKPGHMGAADMEAMHRVMEFLVRLLADPQVEARIHGTPRLHELWQDAELQRMIRLMRRMHPEEGGS